MVRDKVRFRFRKLGDLRLISHHDLMRCFERMLRRASIPYHATQGFNPKPRLVFALSLPLGVVGLREIAELELDDQLSLEELHQRLAQVAPPGLEILAMERIAPKTTAHVCQVRYRLPIPPDRLPALPERIAALLTAAECWIERTRPQPRRFDARPYLDGLRLVPLALEMDLRVTPTGSVRPDEVLELLGVRDLLDHGAVLERTDLVLAETEVRGQGPGVSETPDLPLTPGP